jgi:hypothetical protein
VLRSVGLVYACTCLPDTAVLRADACVVIRYVDDDEWVELDLPGAVRVQQRRADETS